MLLHIGATTPAGVALTVAVIFLLIFAMSFAFGPVPEGGRRFSREWAMGWLRASIPRMLIAGLFAGAVLVGALAYGNNSSASPSSCDSTLPPLTGTAVTDQRISVAINSLNQMVDAANQGDTSQVSTIWYTSDAHNLTHDIDRPLRTANEGAAKSLCQNVIALENVMVGQIVASKVVTDAQQVADLLQQARPILASQTSTPFPVIVTPCDQPVGAVTSTPLTRQRLQAGIDSLNQASSLAGAGDEAGAQTAFTGDAHNLTHDIDEPLRAADEQLAIKLCQSVVDIEGHLGTKYDAGVMQREAAALAGYIQQGGKELGILQ